MAGPWANLWAMQLDAALNIFDREDDPEDTSALKNDSKWRISTKFETPMLDFSYIDESDMTLNGALGSMSQYQAGVNSVIPRGMWHQFGRLPLSDQGVYMQVTDIPDDFLDNHPASHVVFDPAGRFDIDNAINIGYEQEVVTDSARSELESGLTGYRLPQNARLELVSIGNVTEMQVTPKPLSLVDICGFSTDPVRIGEVPETKKVFEAIVAVPFVEEEGERRFFSIAGTDARFGVVGSEAAKSSNTILRQERLMEKYIFPPTFDFVNNDVPAMAMYVFEFSHEFTKDDLAHMWQNLSPKIGTQAAPSSFWQSHQLRSNQLLGFSTSDTIESITDDKPAPLVDFPEKLQWMVFKVKQRAKANYFEQIGSKQEASVPFYTDNWPYDYFSLIELASIDAEVTFEPTVKNKSIRDKKRVAADEALTQRVVDARQRPIDVNIKEED